MNRDGNEIVMLVEGKTEKAIKPVLKTFLDKRCEAKGKPKVRLSAVTNIRLAPLFTFYFFFKN